MVVPIVLEITIERIVQSLKCSKMFMYSLFSLFYLYLIFIGVNGDETYNDNEMNFNSICSPGDDSCSHDEVLWTSPLSSISLQVKDAGPTLKNGVTGHAYHLVRQPAKKIDKQARKQSSFARKTLRRGVAGTDGYVRRGTLLTHNLLKQGIVGLDNTMVRGVGAAHGTLRSTSGYLDNLLMSGTKRTHSAVKYTGKSLDSGVKHGSKFTYGTMKKGVTAVDRRLQTGVRTVDKQFSGSGRSMKSIWRTPQKLASKMIPHKKKKSAPPAAAEGPETPSDIEEEVEVEV